MTDDRAAAILQQLNPSHVRDLRSISPMELANPMCDGVEQSAGIAEEPLFREVLARVGARRLTPEVQAHLAGALEAAQELGRLRRAGEVLLPG